MRALWPLLAAGAALGAVFLLSSSAGAEAEPLPAKAIGKSLAPRDAFFVTIERSMALARELNADPPTNPIRLRVVSVTPEPGGDSSILAEVADIAQLQGQTGKRVTVRASDVLSRSPG